MRATAAPPLPASSAGLLQTAGATCGRTLRVIVRTPQLVGATLGQGILFLLVFRYVFGGAIDTGGLAYIDYMTPGILTAALLFAASGAAVGVAEDRAAGFTDRILTLPTSRAGIALGRIAADTVVVAAAASVTLAAAFAVGFRPQAGTASLAAAAGFLGLYAVAFAALFAALGTLADGPQTAQSFGFVAIPLTFVSSAYVPTDTMPGWLAVVARNQPVTHMVDALRAFTQPASTDSASAGIAVAAAAAIAVGAGVVTGHRLAHIRTADHR